MPNVSYVLPDGSEREIDVPAGQSVMDGSVRNNLPGIVAECGGSCSCATCHVLVRRGNELFAPASAEEAELLEFTQGAEACSRLACQLIMSDSTVGVVVEPAVQA